MVNRIAFGLPGHEHEFCVNFDDFDLNSYIPQIVESWIKNELHPYGFFVVNRGSRIEILPPLYMWRSVRPGDCEWVFEVIKKLFPDIEFTTEYYLDGEKHVGA